MYCVVAPSSFCARWIASQADWLNDLSSILPMSVTRPTQNTSGLAQSAFLLRVHAGSALASASRTAIARRRFFNMPDLLGRPALDTGQRTKATQRSHPRTFAHMSPAGRAAAPGGPGGGALKMARSRSKFFFRGVVT